MRHLISFLLLSFLLPAHLLAATLFVANDGEDVDLCGTRAEPCRTISQAIANSNSNDRISVGPGIYGDVDFDGDFDRDDEESALESGEAMIEIAKPIRLLSRDGAAATIIHVGEEKNFAVSIVSSNVTIGGKGKGFTIRGGSVSALFVEGSGAKLVSNTIYSDFGDGARVGCYDTNDDDEDEFFGTPSSGIVANTIFNHSSSVGLVLCSNSSGWKIRRSQASFNGSRGVFASGDGHRFSKTVVSGNLSNGLRVGQSNSTSLTQFISAANRASGIYLEDDGKITGKNSAIIGNRGAGVFVLDEFSMANSSIYGNNSFDNSGLAIENNCGFFDNSNFDPSVERVYWGSPDGPSVTEPADNLCSQIKSPEVSNFLAKERRVRTSQPIQ